MCCFEAFLVYIVCMYTKIVIVVNVAKNVDKTVFLFNFKHLE